MSRKWYFKVVPSELLSDPGLRMCSSETVGVWVFLLSVMHAEKEGSQRCGYLDYRGRPASIQEAAILAGRPANEVKRAIDELLDHGVFERDEDGFVFSPRMVKDAAKSALCSAAGKRGAAIRYSDKWDGLVAQCLASHPDMERAGAVAVLNVFRSMENDPAAKPVAEWGQAITSMGLALQGADRLSRPMQTLMNWLVGRSGVTPDRSAQKNAEAKRRLERKARG